LANKWQEALVKLAFTPCLQYQYAAGKNTSDIALALDAIEALFDRRADTFCLVTSDSDFAYLCRKLRERGATVHIVGEAKSPDALRNASDQFFEWVKPEPAPEQPKATAQAAPEIHRRSGHAARCRHARRQGHGERIGVVSQASRSLVFPQDVWALGPAGHAQDLRPAQSAAGARRTLDNPAGPQAGC
jgi:hypothetical protein